MTIDLKAEKGNMMSKVFVFSMLVIQVVGFQVLREQIKDQITFAFWKFFDLHKTLLMYLVAINFVVFAAFAVDKINAIQHRTRKKCVIAWIDILGRLDWRINNNVYFAI